MKVPGYIEGPYGRFPPFAKKICSRSPDCVEIDSDMAESGSEVHRSRTTILRPGRAERVFYETETDSRQECGHGDTSTASQPGEGSTADPNMHLNLTEKSLAEVRELFAGLQKAADSMGTDNGDLLAGQSEFPQVANLTDRLVVTEKHPDINLLQDAIDGSPEICNISSPTPLAAGTDCEDISPPRVQTFFSKMPASFTTVQLDGPHNHIPTLPFLDACQEIPKILDLMGGRAFSPVKADLNGNITKLRVHHATAPAETDTLQKLVIRERDTPGLPAGPNATEALLWLKRSLTFMDVFLMELLRAEEKETSECATQAYKMSLKPYHNFVVRGVFHAALYALPRRKDFIVALAERKEDANDAVFVGCLMADAREYSAALQRVVAVLNDFYTAEGLA